MADVELRGIRAGFDGSPVLNGVDLTVPTGSITAILGPSGCGKSTLLRIIAGFHQALEGEVRIAGHVVAGPHAYVRPERRGVGIVPQEGALFPHLSVAGNVAFGLASKRGSQARVEEMLELVGLGGLGRRMPQELSGGQQQRVALARALAPQPEVILLDEPFSSLDASLRTELREDVARVLRLSGATAMLVTHDQSEAMSMADSIAVMRNGIIAQAGEPREVYAQPADLEVALRLGDIIAFDMHSSRELRCCGLDLVLIGGPTEEPVDDAAATDPVTQSTGTEGVTGAEPGAIPPVAILRPEQVRVSTATETVGEHANAIVTELHFYGPDAAVLLEPLDPAGNVILSHGGCIRARVPGTTTLRRDSLVRVDIDGPASVVGGNPVAGWRNSAKTSALTNSPSTPSLHPAARPPASSWRSAPAEVH